jgi:hypothetical protein
MTDYNDNKSRSQNPSRGQKGGSTSQGSMGGSYGSDQNQQGGTMGNDESGQSERARQSGSQGDGGSSSNQ